ncbi:phosphoribosyltransferase [Edaphobacter dinghuensis]|uniref:phosphoribosyltransferase n=1 Tax=Edaphobacter dinghuensis TaxID=1560005 RepID=UPI00166D7A2C|nr:phosphoribosyltransferase family protein [Edaphobacter dinghuensis]
MFHDRRHAGELLAGLLADYRSQAQTVVLALPRGGVPVARAVADALALPLDLLLVHKIGALTEPELAIGAVAADGTIVLDERAIAAMRIPEGLLKATIDREQTELARRSHLYRGDQPALTLEGQTAILIDDGLATGYTMLAAVGAAHRLGASRIVVAIPVALQSTIDRLRREADAVVCVDVPRRLNAVGQFYEDFRQVNDQAVCAALTRQTN